jgi:Dna[CI] antecedent, DciA
MGSKATPLVPLPRHVRSALQESSVLGALLARRRAVEELWRMVAPILPAALAQGVKPGTLQDGTWTLLANHAATAAKLRQLAPQVQAHLQGLGVAVQTVSVKVVRQGTL